MPYQATLYELRHEDGPFVRGSTNDKKARHKNHKANLSSGTSDFQVYVRENGGWDKVDFAVIREWECADGTEQFCEEGKFIDEVFDTDPLCFNMKRAGITPRSPIGKLYKLTIAGKWFYYGRCRDDYLRFAAHKTSSKASMTKLYTTIRENGGWEAVEKDIVWKGVCSDEELKEREDELIRANWENELLLNSMPASTTPERKRELNNIRVKKWMEAHPEEAREAARARSARWRSNNPEKAKEVQRRHREKRKDDPARKDYNKKYREEHREELNRKKREKRAAEKASIPS
jgi:hypothetical protein